MKTALVMLVAVLCLWVQPSGCASILAIFPLGGMSHWQVFRGLLVELSRRGHRLTVVTPFQQEGDPWNHVQTKSSLGGGGGGGGGVNFLDFGKLSHQQQFLLMFKIGEQFCQELMEDEGVQSLINSQDEKFELLIIEAFFHDCLLAFAHKFKTPIVGACATGAGATWTHAMVGNPYPLSYLPEIGVAYTTNMNLFQRTYNIFSALTFNAYRHYFYLPALDQMVQKYFKDPSIPPLAKLESNTSLMLLNTHFSFDYSRPLVPNIIEIAGMHIKTPKKLPQDLQIFMDTATDGVIYFSMGSNIKSTDFPEDMRNMFLKVFSKLKQKVLWKLETESLPNQPANVKISKWLPQSDILAHRNLKFFITHGGMMSVQEALHFAVPLLGVPIYGDQEPNLLKVQSLGYGIMLLFNNITEKSFQWAVNELLLNPRYVENARKYSRLFHDRPQKPLDTAVYWTEYVLRHKGAYHMRSGALDLTWYQYFLLDVIFFLLVCILSALLVMTITIKYVVKYIFGTKHSASEKKKSAKND
ncbi:UDP-glucosyltransferase 2-like isoform X1 [Schistocerca americana]|uniref:UDP-glucosyltransferase 2-like isoform X1 n=2 Tax=Schistocerca americana TaxID=7009 RepID=UPI001F4FEEAA|nr:UDP-glucosyltransferase 2-like isoform X1 [Schistocerca americana]